MKVKVIGEYGYEQALFGLGLSHGKTSHLEFSEFIYETGANIFDTLTVVAKNLVDKDCGHNKFMRQICVWLDIDTPPKTWSEFDTYKVGTVTQSESTMHTLGKIPLTQEDFEYPIRQSTLDDFNSDSVLYDTTIWQVKNRLPEGFLQRRIVSLNYQVLREVIKQRANHRLPQWKILINELKKQLEHPELLPF